eukprot:TRINITY_DN6288_c0_g1_i3.p2 TRINITY_DN6288_c0_g1~~TRINITY_DN6288_c0_g1_i3.p2  ORF type:complete len:274 (-),score=20.32 TRINITY_DN6288_c0_g1_i3:327-1073(-)
MFFLRLDIAKNGFSILTLNLHQIQKVHQMLIALQADQNQIIQLILTYPVILKDFKFEVVRENISTLLSLKFLGHQREFFSQILNQQYQTRIKSQYYGVLNSRTSDQMRSLSEFLKNEVKLTEDEIKIIFQKDRLLLLPKNDSSKFRTIQFFREKFEFLKFGINGDKQDIVEWPQYLTLAKTMETYKWRVEFLKSKNYQFILPSQLKKYQGIFFTDVRKVSLKSILTPRKQDFVFWLKGLGLEILDDVR